jgi:hypothetical protein
MDFDVKKRKMYEVEEYIKQEGESSTPYYDIAPPKLKAYIKKVYEFRSDFYMLSPSCDEKRFLYYHSIAADPDFQTSLDELTFTFTVTGQMTVEQVNDKLQAFKSFVLGTVKKNKAEYAEAGVLVDYIRDRQGKEINPFDRWLKYLRLAREHFENPIGADGVSKLAFVKSNKELQYWKEPFNGENEVHNLNADSSALKQLGRDMRRAEELIRRAEVGTFPYDENGCYSLD